MSPKTVLLFFPLISALLTGCKTVENVKGKIADIQTERYKKRLPDGTILHYNVNITPTTAWGCRQVGTIQTYDWHDIQTRSQFSMGGEHELMLNKGIQYLQANQLTANYARLGIPETTAVFGFDVDSYSPATVTFFRCKSINPDRQMGVSKRTEWMGGVGP